MVLTIITEEYVSLRPFAIVDPWALDLDVFFLKEEVVEGIELDVAVLRL